MKMKLARIITILSVLVLFSLYTTVNAAPPLNKRQDGTNGNDFNTNIYEAFLPLDPTPEPITRDYYLKLSRAMLAPDGYERLVWTSNDQYPGPMIRANLGDRVVIYVENNLDDNCTIHWHGIFQTGTPYYDGVAGISQCVIQSGQTFIYNFTVGQYGTYWWHSHLHSQYVDGLRGPFIVHDPKDPFLKDYDYEYVMTVSDWYHELAEKLFAIRTTPGYDGFNPVPDSGLISGNGRYDCSRAPPGSKCTSNAPLAIYVVKKGKRYRFRIINTSAEAPFTVSFDEHQMRLVEVEGENIKPVVFNKINIAVGQRYSAIINCDRDVKNFWIRATIVNECIENDNDTINHSSAINYQTLGILRYEGAPEIEPTTTEWNETIINCRDLDHNILELYVQRPPPAPVTDRFTWRVGFTKTQDDIGVATINNSSFVADIDYPTMTKVTRGGKYVGKDLARDQNAYVCDTENGVVEITLLNNNMATHPFHLHGHNFYIMGSGDGLTVDTSTFDDYPSVRDTISILGYSWTVIRFKIDNPGVWAFHCHIDWHASMGMFGQIVERPSVLKNMELPPICPFVS